MQSPDEMFDVCDADDRVIGQATRGEVHARLLLHRAVHIWVVNSRDELLMHLRSDTKDQYPRCYTSSASGHLDAGETYLAAAHRELAEELGLSGELEFLVKLPASPTTAYEHSALYLLRSDAPVTPCTEEIAEVEFLDLERVHQFVRDHPDRCTPPFRELWLWYWKSGQLSSCDS